MNNLINGGYGQGALRSEIIRVKSIDINSFRGIKELKKPLNTDADVVLITGPNGFGKTSLIDALSIVLTGYLHSCRKPILFKLQDKASPDQGLIKAELLTAQGAEKNIEVKVSNNDTPKCSDEIWPSTSTREVSAKASFFYQDLVEQLFDDFTDGKTLKDLLTPSPKEVSDAVFAIKEALKAVQKKERTLVIPGIESEEALTSKREQIAKEFNALWEQLIRIGLKLPAALPAFNILKKDGGLRSGWKDELDKFALELSKSLQEEKSKEEINVGSSLRYLGELLDNIKINYLGPKSNLSERVSYLANSLSDIKKILDLSEPKLDLLKKDCLRSEKNLMNNKKRLGYLLDLEKHYQSSEGPALLEIMRSLRRNGPKWSKIYTPQVGNDIRLPEGIAQWVSAAYSYLMDTKMPLDEVLALWQGNVESKRRLLETDIIEQEKAFAECSTTLNILEEIRAIANASTKGQKLVKEAQIKAHYSSYSNFEFELPVGDSKQRPAQLVDAIKGVLEEWIDVERRDVSRQNALKKSAEYKKVKEQIKPLKDALTRETSKKGPESVLQSILPLPENELQKLTNLINKILKRFRLVQGVLPIKIKTSTKGSGKNEEGTWELVTADGRTFTSLSTGQQSQLAISLLLGLNISLDISYLGHGIIALDDTTTSFDMAQLPREAALLRQIAYGTGDSEGQRRQLFIVSHHEDLTHKLIDYLIPPNGKKMHVLNFVDWSPEDGPEIEQYEMEPAKSAEEGRKELSDFLKAILKEDA